MATTTLLRIKSTRTKSISHILKDRTEYIENDEKTNSKDLVSSFNCTPESAYLDFTASKILYNEFKGTQTKKRDDVLAYHIRQAFSPEDNITPEKAHEIGKKLVEEFTKGKHEYVIATHIDKKHIHNHIIFNSTTIDCTHKFNNHYNSTFTVRTISDRLCAENNLSVVDTKTEKGQHYKEWNEDKNGGSWKSKLKRNIDKCIESSNDFAEFKRAMQDLGYEIKEGRHIAFRAKGQERFTRAKTLGDAYVEENIVRRISEKIVVGSKQKRKLFVGKLGNVKMAPLNLGQKVIISAQKQQIKNVKDLASTLLLLRQEGINRNSDFDLKMCDLKNQLSDIKKNIKEIDNKISAYREVAKYLATMNKHKDIFVKYEKANSLSKNRIFSKNEGDILSYQHAVKKLTELRINIETPLEKVVSEITDFTAKIGEMVKEANVIEIRMREIGSIKKTVELIIDKKSMKLDHRRDQINLI